MSKVTFALYVADVICSYRRLKLFLIHVLKNGFRYSQDTVPLCGRAKLRGRGCKIFFVSSCDLRPQIVLKQLKTLYPESNFRRESIIVLLRGFTLTLLNRTLLCRNS